MINGAQTFLLDDMLSLPGPWSAQQNGSYGQADGCRDMGRSSGCPSEFPFPVINPVPRMPDKFEGQVCCESNSAQTYLAAYNPT